MTPHKTWHGAHAAAAKLGLSSAAARARAQLVLKFLTMYVDGFKYAHLKSTGLQSAWDWIWFFM